ncbi:hypothetical protein QUB08_17425 [Microcoleus sp. BR0-C5]
MKEKTSLQLLNRVKKTRFVRSRSRNIMSSNSTIMGTQRGMQVLIQF